MGQMIFVNLGVRRLDASIAFYEALGFRNNPQFTDETAACMVVSETIHVMLLTHDKMKGFTAKPLADATQVTEVLNALNADSREEVDRLVDAAIAAGGTEPRAAMDLGFMYQRSFDDPDGHIWEIFFMDMSQMPEAG